MSLRLRCLTVLGSLALLSSASLFAQAAPPSASSGVGALGRLQPKDGVRRIAGPSEVVLVLAELLVDSGDAVEAGQMIARLDDHASRQAAVARLDASLAAQASRIVRLEAMLANAGVELQRTEKLASEGVVTGSQIDQVRLQALVAEAELAEERSMLEVARANLKQARVDLERRIIRSPIAGTVLRVHARAGEKVGAEGIVEIGETDRMYAVAEVYETDLPRLKVGQRARVESPVLAQPLQGTVERIARMVGKKSIQDDNPASREDARVVEVEIRLDDSSAAAAFTNLQVQVRFDPQ